MNRDSQEHGEGNDVAPGRKKRDPSRYGLVEAAQYGFLDRYVLSLMYEVEWALRPLTIVSVSHWRLYSISLPLIT